MTKKELIEENKRLKALVDKQAGVIARNMAEIIVKAEEYIAEHTKEKEKDEADWWKRG